MTLAMQVLLALALLGATVTMGIPWKRMRLKGAAMMLVGIAVACVWQSVCPPCQLNTSYLLVVPLCLTWIFFLFGGLIVLSFGLLLRSEEKKRLAAVVNRWRLLFE